ncbi:unnamed protein product [Caenorhabditis angaria]|uniref:Uncharacterized protein n=1 Tax=Caenorhabditis angaria TaxID=860376 RepID=A0A9P1N065_9PELO|nr:unnamed protein product [Caenorhabditis angaria]
MIKISSIISLIFLISGVSPTPSVWSCPLMGQFALGMPVGEDCPTDSFIHYYSCCDDNPFQCCFHFETWAIVVFGITVLVVIVASMFLAGKLLMNSNFVQKTEQRR